MLHREIVSSLPTSLPLSTGPIPIPVGKKSSLSSPKNNKYEKYIQSGETPFFPSSSPPVSDFLRRLEQRKDCYNK